MIFYFRLSKNSGELDLAILSILINSRLWKFLFYYTFYECESETWSFSHYIDIRKSRLERPNHRCMDVCVEEERQRVNIQGYMTNNVRNEVLNSTSSCFDRSRDDGSNNSTTNFPVLHCYTQFLPHDTCVSCENIWAWQFSTSAFVISKFPDNQSDLTSLAL